MVQPTIQIRTLNAQWTVHLSKDSAMQTDKDLEGELAKVLQEEIDWEIMTDMMVTLGWVKVNLNHFKDRYQSIDIQEWLNANCKGHYMNRSTMFIFQKAEDAEWFSLKWL